jgi:glutamate-ammonia-ligase adenylyltransferase
LRHARETPSILLPGTLAALEALHQAGHLAQTDFVFLNDSYRYLRSIEARLRLMNTVARHDLPEDRQELAKLAYLLGDLDGQQVYRDCRHYMDENRAAFNRIFDEAAAV